MKYALTVRPTDTPTVFFFVSVDRNPGGGYSLWVGENQAVHVRDLGGLIQHFTSWANRYHVVTRNMVFSGALE